MVSRRDRGRKAGATTAVIVGLLAMVLALAACGGDGGPAGTSAVSTVASQVDGTPSTPPTSGSSDSLTTSTAPPPETTATSTGATVPSEPLSSAETRLPNGHIKAMGFIHAVWEERGVRRLSIDYAEMLTGPEAVEAAVRAGVIEPGEDVPNDYFISNVNPKLREFTVSDTVSITTMTYLMSTEGVSEKVVDWGLFKSFWSEFSVEGGEHLHDVPWWIERDGDTVVKIAEQYLP